MSDCETKPIKILYHGLEQQTLLFCKKIDNKNQSVWIKSSIFGI